ncbi:Endonuclease 4 [Buchnera aphidicola (Phyllaphis fagi)]|uniref:deoxyribonuclease IV n=1 Tax=Buchnera aphidicola TaxID=9 RepID=UPI003464AE1D
MKKYIGSYISTSGGIEKSIVRAYELGATAISFFTRNRKKWYSSPVNKDIVNKFKIEYMKYNFIPGQILPNSGYLMNLGHPNKEFIIKARMSLLNEIDRCQDLGLMYLNVHPGSHLNEISEVVCLNYVVDSINYALETTFNVTVLLENTAGHGSDVGYCFEHIAYIIDKIEDKSRIGVCLNIGHLFMAGYDLRTIVDCKKVFNNFNKIIGNDYLQAMYINDSASDCNSRIDIHANLGEGKIGRDAFKWIMKQDDLSNYIPIIVETPNSKLWKEEITWLNKISK